MLWFGFELTPKIVVVTLYTFFPITVAFAAGPGGDGPRGAAPDADAGRRPTADAAGCCECRRRCRILFTGLRIAVTYAIVGAVFAEWSGAREGLGIYVLLMKNSFRTDLVFASVFLIAGLSLFLFLMVGVIERLVVRWK